jgi:pantoate--beta-alanine ligase
MIQLHSIDEAQQFVAHARTAKHLVGLIPTMGALHAGHLSLVRQSVEQCDVTIATIFVNPTQFAPGEDLNRYPRTLELDLDNLERSGAAAVFLPTPDEMYPEGYSTFVEPPEIARPLEGMWRPGHFRGVATVVLKLFHALPAHRAYFGRKDYQQVKVVEAMVRDLNLRIAIEVSATVRESDGLAMSSRNRYLSVADRQRAVRLYEALMAVKSTAQSGVRNVAELERLMNSVLLGENQAGNDAAKTGVDSIDYAVIVDADTLMPIARLESEAVALIAARVGMTRLIDNELLSKM